MQNTSKEIEKALERILPRVAKPGRYYGGEYNQIVKDWDDIDFKVALAFPDIYDLGMSNLGLMILYDIVNKHKNLLAERVFSPWTDMEAVMRAEDMRAVVENWRAHNSAKHPAMAEQIGGLADSLVDNLRAVFET